jgi:hypothetical protein
MQINTPNLEDPQLKRLLNKVNATHEPTYLPVTLEPGVQPKDCFIAVQNKVAKDGGRMILGWQIWKSKNLIEAECHAVWEDDNEALHDITPKEFPVDKIIFVEDEKLVYKDKQIDNIRLNITSNELVDDLIIISEAIYRFDNKGERATAYDLSGLLSGEQFRHKEYLLEVREFINIILSTGGRQKALCPCQSGTKFRDCHGKDLRKKAQKDI